MIPKRKRVGAFVIPLFVIALCTFNYFQLEGIENIRAIHAVTLIAIGMAIGVLLRNLLTHFAKDGQNDV